MCLPTTLFAQSELSEDLAVTFAPVAHVDTMTDALGCVALFRSLTIVFGPESELYADFQTREGFMASVAGVLWTDSPDGAGQSSDDVFAFLVPLINGATDEYLAHMDTLAENTDSPFDDQILRQVDFCNAVFDGLQRDAG